MRLLIQSIAAILLFFACGAVRGSEIREFDVKTLERLGNELVFNTSLSYE